MMSILLLLMFCVPFSDTRAVTVAQEDNAGDKNDVSLNRHEHSADAASEIAKLKSQVHSLKSQFHGLRGFTFTYYIWLMKTQNKILEILRHILDSDLIAKKRDTKEDNADNKNDVSLNRHGYSADTASEIAKLKSQVHSLKSKFL